MGKAELRALQEDSAQAGAVSEARGTIHLLSPIRNPPQLRPALGTQQVCLSFTIRSGVSERETSFMHFFDQSSMSCSCCSSPSPFT